MPAAAANPERRSPSGGLVRRAMVKRTITITTITTAMTMNICMDMDTTMA
jgi:hypothetical protein